MGGNHRGGALHGVDIPFAVDVCGKANAPVREKNRDDLLGHISRRDAAAVDIWAIIYPVQPTRCERRRTNQPDGRVCGFTGCEKTDPC